MICLKKVALAVAPCAVDQLCAIRETVSFFQFPVRLGKKQAQDCLLNRAVMFNPEVAVSSEMMNFANLIWLVV